LVQTGLTGRECICLDVINVVIPIRKLRGKNDGGLELWMR